MPREVDVTRRLREIAEATLELAVEEGPAGVTVRAVAARLGGSTTLVTKYLPSRPELLANAFRFVNEGWETNRAHALSGKSGVERVQALVNWSLQTDQADEGIRRLWMEALSGEPGTGSPEAQEEATSEQGVIRTITREAGLPAWSADLLFLALRGYYVSSVEDPDNWPPERARVAIDEVLKLTGKTTP